jgi:hypothetical protein
LAIPPGESFMSRLWSRHTTLVRERRCRCSDWPAGALGRGRRSRTSRVDEVRNAATATDRASFGSFLSNRPRPNSRIRDANVGHNDDGPAEAPGGDSLKMLPRATAWLAQSG